MKNSLSLSGSGFDGLFDDYDYNISTIFPSYDANPCTNTQSINKNFVIIVYVLVFFLSLVGNSLVVLVICYNKIKRSSTDVYLLNLAIADILFAITLPFWAIYKAHEWIFGTFMCKVISAVQEVNFYSGILLLACISIDRYLAIVHAMETVTQKRHLVKFICVGIWIFSIMLSVPVLLYRTVFDSPQKFKVCHEDLGPQGTDQLRIILRVSRHIIGFFLPLLIMLFCYSFTIKTLCQTKSSQKHRAMKVIFAVVLVFLCCWLPYNITVVVDSLMRSNIVNQTCEVRNQVDTALSVTEIFGFIHSCINPILYAFIGQKFRNSFLRILVTKGIVSKNFFSRYGRGSVASTSGNTSTTL
ncbi:C-X-C chemokine receptor type 1 [Microcaecilia unicolor]|uniref:C-X-C chemokine receptor type 2 n=1 Tax=Microcaecilia unicolor TaxID=1415580 RepID=A0A6P7YGA7_9AMPH|nr:C-X-C chemokine receptor type 1-like [Microcaecilia unicolor]